MFYFALCTFDFLEYLLTPAFGRPALFSQTCDRPKGDLRDKYREKSVTRVCALHIQLLCTSLSNNYQLDINTAPAKLLLTNSTCYHINGANLDHYASSDPVKLCFSYLVNMPCYTGLNG